MEIALIEEIIEQESTLKDGVYLGVWTGTDIEVKYQGRRFKLTASLGTACGMGYSVAVYVKDDKATFERLMN